MSCPNGEHQIKLMFIDATALDHIILFSDCIICHGVPSNRQVAYTTIMEWLKEETSHETR